MDEMNEEMKPKESLLDKIKSRLKMIKPDDMPRTANNTADFILPRVVEIKGKYYVKVPDKYLRKAKLDHETTRLTYEADLKEKQISITKNSDRTKKSKFRWLRDIMQMEINLVSKVLYNYPDMEQRIRSEIKTLEEKYKGVRMSVWQI
jgi:hypothetical protein